MRALERLGLREGGSVGRLGSERRGERTTLPSAWLIMSMIGASVRLSLVFWPRSRYTQRLLTAGDALASALPG